MRKQDEIQHIRKILNLWLGEIALDISIKSYDVTKFSEDLAMALLNEIYEYELVNLNKMVKPNYPGIDLGDKNKAKLAFQITSRTDAEKIKDSLQKFVSNREEETYTNGIRFLILSLEKVKYGRTRFEEIYQGFNKDEHILYLVDLYREIDNIYDTDEDKFNRIKQLLDREFRDYWELKEVREQHISIPDAIILQDNSSRLGEKYRGELDNQIRRLCDLVFCKGKYPPVNKMEERINDLIKHLENSTNTLSLESQIEGYITITDGLLFIEKNGNIKKAREYYDKNVCTIFSKLQNQSPWEERVLRLKAKLLFLEDKHKKAIKLISHSEDPKTISFLLNFLISSGQIEEAYKFITTHEHKIEWICEVIYILINKNKVKKAEEIFQEVLAKFDIKRIEQKLEDTPYKNESFYEKLYFAIVNALYLKAIKLPTKKTSEKILPVDMPQKSKKLLAKLIYYIDRTFERLSKNPLESYHIHRILLIEMSTAFFLKDFNRMDKAIINLIPVKPIDRLVVSNLMLRFDSFDRGFLEAVSHRLEVEHTDQLWSFMIIADIENQLGNKKRAFEVLKKVFPLIRISEDKLDLLVTLVEFSRGIGKLDEVFESLKELFSKDESVNRFLKGLYLWHKGNHKSANAVFKILKLDNFDDGIKAVLNFYQAITAMEEEKWTDSRDFFKKSLNFNMHPPTLYRYLFVLAKLQEHKEILDVADQLIHFNAVDENVLFLKAQAAKNLRQYAVSERTWRELNKQSPLNPVFAFGLADVLSTMDKDTEALEFLEKFIQPDEYFNKDCLKLASQIFDLLGNPKKSFDVLDRCYSKISYEPELLYAHMNMGFKTGEEDKANKSLLILKKLQEDVEEPKLILRQLKLEEIVELFKKRTEEYDKYKREYTYGKIPRIVLCTHKKVPIYLDWAIRTQQFSKRPFDKNFLTDFTIYSTNGICIEFNKNGPDRFLPIKVPIDSDEIIIDVDALITAHRLGLIEKLTARYEKIYYPEVLKRILKVESSQYNSHQYKKEKIYRQLNNKITNGEIIEIPAKVSGEIQDMEKRDLSLAQTQDIPLINNFIEKDKVKEFPEVFVLRISQITDFLHEQGQLQKDKCEEIKESFKIEPLLSLKNWGEKILESSKVVVSEITLQLMEEFNINQMLLEIGIQIIVERESAYQIERNVANLDFGKEVEKWNRDLNLTLKETPRLQPICIPITLSKEKKHEDVYADAATDSLVFMEQERLPLLTDDRWVQMLGARVIPGHQFGTGALLVDLFEKGLISIEVYANSFLKLCQWRYRYLLPDIRVLNFFAQQYKDALPGKELKIIAAYFRDCMDIPGLFLGTEPTNPPGSIGLRYYLGVVDCLLEFLVFSWENESFDEKNLNRLAEWFFISGLPDLPVEIPWSKRVIFYKGSDRFWTTKLFALIISSKNHLRLHELLENSLKYFSTEVKTKKAILLKYIRYIKDLAQYHGEEKISSEDFKNIAIYKGLEALYGYDLSKIILSPELVSLLIENGFDLKFNEPKIPDRDIKILRDSLDREIKIIKGQVHKEGKTSVLLITQKDQHNIILSVLHNLIRHPSPVIKKKALKIMLLSNNISDPTKKRIQLLKIKVLSDNSLDANAAAEKIESLLLHDFDYAIALYNESVNYQCQDVLKVAWKALISPTLETVTSKPFIIKKKFDVELNKKKLRQKAASFVDLKSFLDWYLREYYFIPLDSPLNPWGIVTIFISSKDDNLSNLDIFYAIKEWLHNNRDPLAYIMGLDIILSIKIEEMKHGSNTIDEDIFYNLIEKLFEVLILEETEDMRVDKNPHKNVHLRWEIRKEFANYYLGYIELKSPPNSNDLENVLLAWWMAKQVEQALRFVPIETENYSLSDGALRSILGSSMKIHLHHIFHGKKKNSISRYVTFSNLSSILEMTMSVLYSKVSDYGICQIIKQSSLEFFPKYSKVIIKNLEGKTILGDGRVFFVRKENLPVIWYTPLIISAQGFLKVCFKDEFSTEDNLIIEKAEKAANPEFLSRLIDHYPVLIKKKKNEKIFKIMSSSLAFYYSNGNLPKNIFSIFTREDFLTEIFTLDQPWNIWCILALIRIMEEIVQLEKTHWIDDLIKKFKRVDYKNFSINHDDFEKIIIGLATVALFTSDTSILTPIFEKKFDQLPIKRIFNNIESLFKNIFPSIPVEKKETLKKILNLFEDIESFPSTKYTL